MVKHNFSKPRCKDKVKGNLPNEEEATIQIKTKLCLAYCNYKLLYWEIDEMSNRICYVMKKINEEKKKELPWHWIGNLTTRSSEIGYIC